jgi:hypothetical protein
MRALLILLVACVVAGCAVTPDSIGDPPWGASPEEIRERRAADPEIAMSGRLIYHADFAGLPATLVYRFGDAGLDELVAVNRAGHADRNRYLEDFERVATMLRARYGAPELAERQWHNRLFADEPERLGDAISAGHLDYISRWETPRTRVLMTLRGERYQVLHEIIFRPGPAAH